MGSARFSIALGASVGSVVVTVQGELDHACAGHLESVLDDLIDSQDQAALSVDLHDARGCDSEALSVFRRVAERAESRGASLVLSGTPDAIYAALETSGLARLVGGDRPPRGGSTAKTSLAPGSKESWQGDHPAGAAQPWDLRRPGIPEKSPG